MPGERRAEVAAQVYSAFVSSASGAQPAALESLYAAHPELADELAALHDLAVEDLYVALLEERRAGRAVDLEQYCAAHPLHARDLREAERDAQALAGLAQELGASGAAPEGLGRYHLRRLLGQGSMGQVYEVWDEELRRSLALKLFTREATDAPLRARFIEEAQVTSQLDHPGIVPVHDLGFTPAGQPYITMKLVKGGTLGDAIASVQRGDAAWPLARGVECLARVCEAVGYAHHKQLLHRDLKPQNVMVGRYGAVYVVDWGLARAFGRAGERVELEGGLETRVAESVRSQADAAPLHTVPGTVIGTPFYMAPELCVPDRAAPDPRVDVYSVGAMLYFLLAGRRPYERPGESSEAHQVLAQLATGAPAPLAQVAPGAAPQLVQVAQRAMARDPEQRYASMEALAEDLRAALAAQAPPALSDSLPPDRPPRAHERRLGALELLLLGVLIFILGLWAGRWFAAP